MKNVFAFKIFCMELHKIQSKLTGKESLQRVILTDSTKCKGNLTIGTTILEKKCEIS